MLRDANIKTFSAVYLVCGYTDMRYGIDSLATIVQHKYKLDVFAPRTLFLFCGKRTNRIKGLLWEGDGFLLLYKRLEKNHFAWPKNRNDVLNLSPQQYEWLMIGFPVEPVIQDVTPLHSA